MSVLHTIHMRNTWKWVHIAFVVFLIVFFSDLCISVNKFAVKIFVCFASRTNLLHQLYSSLSYYVGARHIKHWWFLFPVSREAFHSFGTLNFGYCWQQVFIISLWIVLVRKPGPRPCSCNEIASNPQLFSPIRKKEKCNKCKNSSWVPPGTVKWWQLVPFDVRLFFLRFVKLVCFTKLKKEFKIISPAKVLILWYHFCSHICILQIIILFHCWFWHFTLQGHISKKQHSTANFPQQYCKESNIVWMMWFEQLYSIHLHSFKHQIGLVKLLVASPKAVWLQWTTNAVLLKFNNLIIQNNNSNYSTTNIEIPYK